LLGAVEKGTITLIGATTENPSFEVISALLSRCQVYTLKHHDKSELLQLLHRAINEDSLLKTKTIDLKETHALLAISGGDARKLLNVFELIIGTFNAKKVCVITDELVQSVAQQALAIYDKDGEQHYDIISAFIKSIRGSDPNAAIYWLARMVEAGEDPKFIARRLLISASEDIGLANPNALLMANNCFQAIQTIGFPEARIILAQCTIYLASSPKSNRAYNGINKAQQDVREKAIGEVPAHLRDRSYGGARAFGHGINYEYPHDFEGAYVNQQYLPTALNGTTYYEPSDRGDEKALKAYLEWTRTKG
jgi:putative ATPase